MAAVAPASLRAAANTRLVAAWSFSDEQAAQVLTVTNGLRALFLPPPVAASAVQQTPTQLRPNLLQLLPTELLSEVLAHLDTYDLARLAATCRLLWRDAPTPPPRPMTLLRPMGPVEAELRRRASARGLRIVSCLPEGALSCVPYLLKRALRDALRREAPLAAGDGFSLFLDAEGRLLSCGSNIGAQGPHLLLGHGWGTDINPAVPRSIGPPTLVPSMQGRRIVSVAAGEHHCLALSCEGEVYSWGDGGYGSLGHAARGARAVPSRIESLSHIESIAAGPHWTSAAVDEVGRLFTWGRATSFIDRSFPSGLGYALDLQAESQLTPKRVDALSQERAVGVAFGDGFTLAVTDAGAVFSFGHSPLGALGHGSLVGTEVLPRRIEALTQTGRRFVARAASFVHAFALNEDGALYGWGHAQTNSHGRDEYTLHQVTAFVGQRVKSVDACSFCSCAITEKGELYTWGGGIWGILGHGDEEDQLAPKRVEGLNGVRVAATATCQTHTLVADEDGVVWAFGKVVGLGDPDTVPQERILEPIPIPSLRVRTSKSPDVLPFR